MLTIRNTAGCCAVGALALVLLVGAGIPAAARQAEGRGRMMMHDADHRQDMQLFHELFDNRQRITRQVTLRPDGVETLTESDDPAVARTIQAHVESMSARVKEARPIHQRDPFFREIFRNADKIVMRYDATAKGVRVVETSVDPYVVKLIQAHADVVSAFIANGRSEMMKNHAVPSRDR